MTLWRNWYTRRLAKLVPSGRAGSIPVKVVFVFFFVPTCTLHTPSLRQRIKWVVVCPARPS